MTSTVLLADDDRAIRESLVRAMELEEYRVIPVPNGVQALNEVRRSDHVRRGRPARRDLLRSRDVISQIITGAGGVAHADHDDGALPVYSSDKEIAALDPAGERAEREFTPRGGEELRVVTVSLGGGRGAVQLARSISRTDALIGGLARRMAGAAAVVLLLAVLLGRLVARRMTRDLERLTGAAEEVAAGGRLDLMLGPAEATRWPGWGPRSTRCWCGSPVLARTSGGWCRTRTTSCARR